MKGTFHSISHIQIFNHQQRMTMFNFTESAKKALDVFASATGIRLVPDPLLNPDRTEKTASFWPEPKNQG